MRYFSFHLISAGCTLPSLLHYSALPYFPAMFETPSDSSARALGNSSLMPKETSLLEDKVFLTMSSFLTNAY